MAALPALDLELVAAERFIAIIRASTVARFAATARTLVSSGMRLLEFPLSTTGVCDVLPQIVDEHRGAAYVGAGSVTTLDRAQAAHQAGAQFLVTPNLDLRVIEYALAAAVPIFVGALSPSEIHAAWAAGATAVKVFPASVGGPGYIRELRGGPYPDIPLIPTGGVTLDGVPAFLEAGAVALGVGSTLLGSTPGGGAQDELRDRVAEFRARAGC